MPCSFFSSFSPNVFQPRPVARRGNRSRNTAGGEVAGWSLHRKAISAGATLLALPLTRCTDPMSGFFALPKVEGGTGKRGSRARPWPAILITATSACCVILDSPCPYSVDNTDGAGPRCGEVQRHGLQGRLTSPCTAFFFNTEISHAYAPILHSLVLAIDTLQTISSGFSIVPMCVRLGWSSWLSAARRAWPMWPSLSATASPASQSSP